ncbi:hypothetical protein THAOC_07780, partial [Thalassiosira oceanica]
GNVNHFGPDCNRLIRTAGDGTFDDQVVIGRNARIDLSRLSRRKTVVVRDANKNFSLFCRGLKGRNLEEMLDHIISGLKEDRKKGTSDVQDTNVVLQSFISYARDNNLYVDPTLVDDLLERYKGECLNPGNTKAQKTNTRQETRRNNGTIQELVDKGGYGWVQGWVVDGYNAAGEGYTPPEPGEPMGRLRVKGGVEMEVTYCVNPPAIPIDSMVYETVLGRFSGKQTKGTIDAERATRYKRSDYTVKTAESYALQRWGMGHKYCWTKMINKKKEKGTDKPIKLPKKNAVLIWIEPKSKKK